MRNIIRAILEHLFDYFPLYAVVVLLSLVALGVYIGNQEDMACQAKGGVIIQGHANSWCVAATVLE